MFTVLPYFSLLDSCALSCNVYYVCVVVGEAHMLPLVGGHDKKLGFEEKSVKINAALVVIVLMGYRSPTQQWTLMRLAVI